MDEMSRTEHLVHVDNAMDLTDNERAQIKLSGPIDMEKLVRRRSQIAKKAHEFL